MSITCFNLSFSYGGRQVLDDVSFSLRRGKITALLGRNGAGKSTLLHCMAGLERPSADTLHVDQLNLQKASRRAIARNVSLVAQEHSNMFPFRVLEVVAMGRTPHLAFFSAPDADDYDLASNALREIGIADLADRIFTQLSGGQKQLVLLARALVQSRRVMLLDEPTNHLDYRNRYQMLHLLRTICDTYQSTILMSLHEPNHALQFADDVLFMQDGRIVKHGTVHDVMNSESVSRLYDLPTSFHTSKEVPSFCPRCIGGGLPRLLILTGDSGTGKTMLLEWLVNVVQQRGQKVAGVMCPGEMENGVRSSFSIQDITTGKVAPLGKRSCSANGNGRFEFSEVGLAAARKALSVATCKYADVVVVDEVGPLELQGGGFHSLLSPLLALTHPVHVWVVRPSIVEQVIRHWLVTNPVVVNVTDENAAERLSDFMGGTQARRGAF